MIWKFFFIFKLITIPLGHFIMIITIKMGTVLAHALLASCSISDWDMKRLEKKTPFLNLPHVVHCSAVVVVPLYVQV